MLVNIALLMSLALMPWTHASSIADTRVSLDDAPGISKCGSAQQQQGPSLDDPNVDTDPDRPITEHASMNDGPPDGDDDQGEDEAQGDEFSNGMCRSETLELWFERDPNMFLHASLATARTVS